MYLSGAVRPELVGTPDLGWMINQFMGNKVDLSRTPWGVDHGTFLRPERFDLRRYLAWLEQRRPWQATNVFATLPDKWGGGRESLALSLAAVPALRATGYRVALPAQDGFEDLALPWADIDVLFVGGTDAWRRSEAMWGLVAEAQRRGLGTHFGRVNSEERVMAAHRAGFDSCDGTWLAFGKDANLPRLLRALRRMREQPALALE